MAITVQRNGLTFAVRPFSADLFVFGQVAAYWPLLNLQPADRVLDIGGHLGAFALPAATVCQQVDVYEPDAESYTLLTWNFAANGLMNVRSSGGDHRELRSRVAVLHLHRSEHDAA